MKNITIKVLNAIRPYTAFYIDGKRAKIVKKGGEKYIYYQTENPTFTLSVENYGFLHFKLWFLWELIFFFISGFGIFDKRIKKPYLTCSCQFTLDAGENTSVKTYLLPLRKDGKVLFLESNYGGTEDKNIIEVDPVIKKRNTISKITKLILFAAAVIVAIVLIV